MCGSKGRRILLVVLIGVVIYTYLADPSKGPILPCVFNKITGLYCPGCGMTRAVHSMLKFKFYQALRFNALVWILPIPLICYYFISHKGNLKVARILLILMISISISYGIIRNIYLFNFLAPTVIY